VAACLVCGSMSCILCESYTQYTEYLVLGLPKGFVLRSLRLQFCIYTFKLLALRGRGAISRPHEIFVRALYRASAYSHRITVTRLSGQLEYAGR